MTKYRINATREVLYEFEIIADSKEEAIEEMQRIDLSENTEDYAYNWLPLQIVELTDEEDEE
jgi:hypothetical protein